MMTEREKMAQIIAEYLCPQGKAHKTLYGAERICYSRDNFAECEKVSKCVDALIAAGIGDTTNLMVENEVLQRDVDNLTRTLEEGTEEFQEVQHRADVAERALDKACEDIEQLMDCCRWAADGGVITIKEYTPENATPQAYIDRAEKELAEERKDE